MQINNINKFMNFSEYDNDEKKLHNNKNFSQMLGDALDNVNQMQINSRNEKELLALGELDNLHDLSIASEKAEIALQITISMRNKLVDAYKEIMRMQI